MIKKLFILILCFILSSCGGVSYRMGIKFKKLDKLNKFKDNYYLSNSAVKVKNGEIISFDTPMGRCGVGITTFGILLPIIPIKIHLLNTCNNGITLIDITNKVKALQIKYNGKLYDGFREEKKVIDVIDHYINVSTFKFKIDNFKKFKSAKDKVLIITTNDGFTQEIPIEWGLLRYDSWAFP